MTDEDKEDIVDSLESFAYIIDNIPELTKLVMIDGALFKEAAEEIKSLRLDLSEAIDAIRYSLAHSPRWEDCCDTVLADWDAREYKNKPQTKWEGWGAGGPTKCDHCDGWGKYLVDGRSLCKDHLDNQG